MYICIQAPSSQQKMFLQFGFRSLLVLLCLDWEAFYHFYYFIETDF